MDLFSDLPPPLVTTGNLEAPIHEKISADQKSCPKRRASDKEELKSKKSKEESKTTSMYSLKAFVAERQGERDDMQDASLLLDDCMEELSSCNCGHKIYRAAFYGVFDGHGGNRASTFVKENLYESIKKNFPKDPVEKFDLELKKSLMRAFKETDEAFIKQASQETPAWRDGSTATCALIINDKLYVTNVGDSKAILVKDRKEGKAIIIPLTKDHSPTEYEERQRIQKAGGFVRDGRVQGVLEVSRALGDARFKKYVISVPDMTKYTFTDKDRYMLISCDGLWKGFQVQEAVNFIDEIVDDTTISDIEERFEKACSAVASEAIRRGSSDNVTVIIVRIRKDW